MLRLIQFTAEAAMRLNVSIGPEASLNLGIAYLLAAGLARMRLWEGSASLSGGSCYRIH